MCGNVQSVWTNTSSVGNGDFESPHSRDSVLLTPSGGNPMNSIIYLVGLVVIVLFVLSFFGLR